MNIYTLLFDRSYQHDYARRSYSTDATATSLTTPFIVNSMRAKFRQTRFIGQRYRVLTSRPSLRRPEHTFTEIFSGCWLTVTFSSKTSMADTCRFPVMHAKNGTPNNVSTKPVVYLRRLVCAQLKHRLLYSLYFKRIGACQNKASARCLPCTRLRSLSLFTVVFEEVAQEQPCPLERPWGPYRTIRYGSCLRSSQQWAMFLFSKA